MLAFGNGGAARSRMGIVIVVLGCLWAVTAWAQQTGGTTGGTSGGGGAPTTGGGRPAPNTGTTQGGNNNTTNPRSGDRLDSARPIFISGRVVLNDGTPISEPIVIERVCGSRTYKEGYTDTRGYFSFQLGQNRSVLPDASTEGFSSPLSTSSASMGGLLNGGGNSDLSETALFQCELRAVLGGYRSDVVSLANRRYMDNPDVGALVLHNLANAPGLTTSATTALAPKEARKSYEKALEALKRSRPDDAQKELLKAVDLYPKFAAAWFDLGQVYERRDHLPEAREAYAKAIAADANFVNPHEHLYMLAAKDAKWQDVADATERVLRLNPYDFPGAYYMSAVANFQLKKFDAAEKSAREAAKINGAHAEPRANFVLGVILANKGDFPAAAESFRTFLKLDPTSPDKDRVQKMLGDVERMAQAKVDPPAQ